MKQEGGARAVEKLIQTYGCLPSIGGGPVLDGFNSHTLAEAIEQEVNKAGDYGWSKITIHLDIPDASKLVQVLRGNK